MAILTVRSKAPSIRKPGYLISVIRHHSQRMGERDPHETHRAATPPELMLDLMFATVCD